MMGLKLVSGFAASLLLNLEGLATAILAVLFFKENAGKPLWLALGFMTAAGVSLSWDPTVGKFNVLGPLLILFAMFCWGTDNNLTRNISSKDPVQITKIKSLFAGTVSLSIAFIVGMKIPSVRLMLFALLLGSFSYGISLVFYIKALDRMGSARTGALFSLAPFVGAVASILILREWIGWVVFPAAVLMALGLWMILTEKHTHVHAHEAVTHTHRHTHDDMHHDHKHDGLTREPHTHEHSHEEIMHSHIHWPDAHHRHKH